MRDFGFCFSAALLVTLGTSSHICEEQDNQPSVPFAVSIICVIEVIIIGPVAE